MPKYQVQLKVTVQVAKTIKADSLEEAMQAGRTIALTCPVDAKLVKLGPGIEYLWNDDTVMTGVTEY